MPFGRPPVPRRSPFAFRRSPSRRWPPRHPGRGRHLFLDIDAVVPGSVAADGSVTFAEHLAPGRVGVVDEIAWPSGARLIAVRRRTCPATATSPRSCATPPDDLAAHACLGPPTGQQRRLDDRHQLVEHDRDEHRERDDRPDAAVVALPPSTRTGSRPSPRIPRAIRQACCRRSRRVSRCAPRRGTAAARPGSAPSPAPRPRNLRLTLMRSSAARDEEERSARRRPAARDDHDHRPDGDSGMQYVKGAAMPGRGICTGMSPVHRRCDGLCASVGCGRFRYGLTVPGR